MGVVEAVCFMVVLDGVLVFYGCTGSLMKSGEVCSPRTAVAVEESVSFAGRSK